MESAHIRASYFLAKSKRQFYIASALASAWFATGNWLFFWRLYLTNGRIGIVDSICFLAGMLAEIPTGAIADKIGRRRIMIIGVVLMGVGYGGMGLAPNGATILVTYLIYSVGSSFYSGADDALMYDYLRSNGDADEWEMIARRKQIITRISAMLAVFIGGYLYIFNVRLPSIARGTFFLLILIPLIKMKFMDSAQPSAAREATTGYFEHIWVGMKELLNRKMLPVVLIVLFIQGISVTMFIGGILRPLMLERTGLPIADHATYLAIVSVAAIIILLHKNRKSAKPAPLYRQAIFYSALIAVGFALNLPTKSLAGGLLGIAFIHIGTYLLVPATSALINISASSKHRATVLSTANLVEDIPYIIASPLIGLAADNSQLSLVVRIVLFTMISAIGLSLVLHRRLKRTATA